MKTGICYNLNVDAKWGYLWYFFLPHYQLLTLAKRQGVCNMAEAWLYPRHGNPCGLQRRPGAHVGSVCWLGDKFPRVRREGGDFNYAPLLCSGGKGVMRSCSDEARQTSVWQRRRGEVMSERDTPTLPQHLAIVSTLSPAYYCFKHPLLLSGWD